MYSVSKIEINSYQNLYLLPFKRFQYNKFSFGDETQVTMWSSLYVCLTP